MSADVGLHFTMLLTVDNVPGMLFLIIPYIPILRGLLEAPPALIWALKLPE